MNPSKLNAAGRHALAACKHAMSIDTLAVRAPVVESYVLACDQLARMQAQQAREGHPSTLVGARGQVIAHPLLGELRRQSRHVADLAKMLGMTRAVPVSMTGRNRRAPDRIPTPLRSVKP